MILTFEMGKASSDGFLRVVSEHNRDKVRFCFHNRQKQRKEMNNGIIPGMIIPHWDEIEKNIPCQAYMFQGLMRGADKIYRHAIETERDFYFIDHPYFFRQKNISGTSYLRFVKNDFSISKITNTDRKKYDEFSKVEPETFKIHNWKKDGKKILVLPPSYWLCKVIGLSPEKLLNDTVNKIKQYTDRPVVVRYKKIAGVLNSKPLLEDLKDTFAIVSMQSNAAITALLNGIPSFTMFDKYSAAVPMSLQDLSKIENPIYPENRVEWLFNLCNHNYTKEQIINGELFNE